MIKTKNFKWNIPIDKKKASEILNLLSENRPNVIISPFSSIRLNNFRNWRSENYSKIIEYLVLKYNCNVFLTGDHSEFDKKNGKLIYVSGETVSVDLDQQLLQLGYNIKRIINYSATHNENYDHNFAHELKLNMPDIVYIYSQNSASSFLKFIKEDIHANKGLFNF